MPDGIDPADAACLVLNYVSAYQLLHRATQVREGDYVLVYNAGGGVGADAWLFLEHTIASDEITKMLPGFLSNVFLNLILDLKRVLNYSITRPQFSSPEWCREDLSILFELLLRGSIKPVVAERIPLSSVIRARETLTNGTVVGKLVLVSS